jgi:hypothetical protein
MRDYVVIVSFRFSTTTTTTTASRGTVVVHVG